MSLTVRDKDQLVVLQRRVKAAVAEYHYESTPAPIRAQRLVEVIEVAMTLVGRVGHAPDTETQAVIDEYFAGIKQAADSAQ